MNSMLTKLANRLWVSAAVTIAFYSQAHADEDKKLTLTFFITNPSLGTSIYNDNYDLEYKSNNGIVPKIGVQYGGLGLSYGTSKGKLDEEIDVSTTNRDFEGFYYFDNFGFDIYFQEYRGYYIDRTPVVPENLYPDLRMTTYTGSYYQKLAGSNKMSAMTTPIPSSETFSSLYYLVASVSDRSIRYEKNLIPDSDRANFPDIDGLQSFHNLNGSISAGAFFPMHLGNYYFNPGLSVGIGAPIARYSNKFDNTYTIKVNLKGSLGYAGEHYRFGLDVSNDSDAFESSGQTTLQFHSIVVTFILLAYTF